MVFPAVGGENRINVIFMKIKNALLSVSLRTKPFSVDFLIKKWYNTKLEGADLYAKY